MANAHFFPAIEPFAHERLAVDPPHELFVEQCGTKGGIPVVFLHGGPGAGCSQFDRRFFDPDRFHIVLFDQRSCGRSTPLGRIEGNDLETWVADIERVRSHLGIEQWHVFGGSWGSSLALLYAEAHPERCSSLVLRGIWLLRQGEITWWLYSMGWIQPELWRPFAEFIPESERSDLLSAYWRRLTGADEQAARAAARAWSIYEGSCCTLLPNEEFASAFATDEVAWALARLEAHLFRNLPNPDTQILDRVPRIRSIPAFAVHGRYDLVCPVKNLIDLAERWPELDTVIVPDAGHSSHEPGITEQLVAATNRIAQTGTPCRSD